MVLHFSRDTKIMQDVIGDVCSAKCINEKCVYISLNETSSFYDSKRGKIICYVLRCPYNEQKFTMMVFGGVGTHCSTRKMDLEYGAEKPCPPASKYICQPQLTTSEPDIIKSFHLWHNCVSILLADTNKQNFVSCAVLFNFSLQRSSKFF